MKKTACVFLMGLLLAITGASEKSAYAASQDECAIWLCLPGGFPQGCSAAHSAMVKRIKSRKPPLPAFGACSESGSGSYQMGYEPFEPCKEGFELITTNNAQTTGRCVGQNIYQACGDHDDVQIEYDNNRCYYQAIKRPKPYFVEMWVSGDYLGKFFYQ